MEGPLGIDMIVLCVCGCVVWSSVQILDRDVGRVMVLVTYNLRVGRRHEVC